LPSCYPGATSLRFGPGIAACRGTILSTLPAYWFTASTSFANPAVTVARSLSDTFAGIAPTGIAAFIVAQLAGMLAAVILSRWLWREGMTATV
jgi:glycerol uptake facilitator-like aquaporin